MSTLKLPPDKPKFPAQWIPVGVGGLFLVCWGFLAGMPMVHVSAMGIGLLGVLISLAAGYAFLKWGGDKDFYDWWNGPGNSRNRK